MTRPHRRYLCRANKDMHFCVPDCRLHQMQKEKHGDQDQHPQEMLGGSRQMHKVSFLLPLGNLTLRFPGAEAGWNTNLFQTLQGVKEIARWLTAHCSLRELVPSTHEGQLTTTCNSRGAVLYWPSERPCLHMVEGKNRLDTAMHDTY